VRHLMLTDITFQTSTKTNKYCRRIVHC